MATAAKIEILLEAQTAALKKGFAEATQSIDRFGKGMSGSVAKGMLKANAAIAAVKAAIAALRGVINATVESIQRLASTADFADRIGASIEALQALQFAAEQNGASADVLNMAMQRLTRRIAQAAAGSGELNKILPELGLSAEKLAGLKPEEQMAIWADAIQNAGDRGEQMRLVMAGMDTEGVALVEMLSQGSEGLARWGEEAAKAGIATEDQARLAQKAAAQLLRWNRVWANFKDLIVAYVLPALTKLIEALGWVVEKLAGLFGGGTDNPLKAAADSAKTMDVAFDGVAKSAEKTEKAVKKTTKERIKSVDVARELAKFRATGGADRVGAVTTAGGAFSAVQEARRVKQDQERRHKEMIATLNKILTAVERGELVLQPVRF